jgi:hypothetical protein
VAAKGSNAAESLCKRKRAVGERVLSEYSDSVVLHTQFKTFSDFGMEAIGNKCGDGRHSTARIRERTDRPTIAQVSVRHYESEKCKSARR